MATTVVTQALLQVISSETPDSTQVGVTEAARTIQLGSQRSTYNSSSAAPVTKAWSGLVALSAGAATLNLAALARANELEDVVLTGLKVQVLHLVAPTTNSSIVDVDVGASNGYNFAGSADSHISLGPGDSVAFLRNESLPDVAAGARTIDFASADVDATIQVHLSAG